MHYRSFRRTGRLARRRIPLSAIRLFPEMRTRDELVGEVLWVVDDRGHGEPFLAVVGVPVEILGDDGVLAVRYAVGAQVSRACSSLQPSTRHLEAGLPDRDLHRRRLFEVVLPRQQPSIPARSAPPIAETHRSEAAASAGRHRHLFQECCRFPM